MVVHESGATRALLVEVLAREGLRVDAVESTFECMARFVDEPADLVLLGLLGLAPGELQLVRTLKDEERPPRILVTYPSPKRDLAVQALEAGADGYLLEPFYAEEVTAVVRGQLAPFQPRAATGPVRHLAREVAHAVNNPLQVMRLLLEKDRVTKKELTDGLPEPLERVEQVVGLLREFSAAAEPRLQAVEPGPILERAADEAGIGYELRDVGAVRVDPAQLESALRALFEGIRLRCGEDFEPNARLSRERDAAAVRVVVPAGPFREEGANALLDAVFAVQPERDVRPGLALPRALLEGMGGSLSVVQDEERLVFVARIPFA